MSRTETVVRVGQHNVYQLSTQTGMSVERLLMLANGHDRMARLTDSERSKVEAAVGGPVIEHVELPEPALPPPLDFPAVELEHKFKNAVLPLIQPGAVIGWSRGDGAVAVESLSAGGRLVKLSNGREYSLVVCRPFEFVWCPAEHLSDHDEIVAYDDDGGMTVYWGS